MIGCASLLDPRVASSPILPTLSAVHAVQTTDGRMLFLALTFVVSFAASVLFTAVVRVVRTAVGCYGSSRRPTQASQRAGSALGRCGGLSGLSLRNAFARCGSFGIGEQLDELAVAVAAAAGLVCLAGCIDDVCQLRSGVKLALQCRFRAADRYSRLLRTSH